MCKKFLLCLVLAAVCALSAEASVEGEINWKAGWITKESQSGTNVWIAFRRRVTLEDVPSSVKARIAVDTKYWLWINGESVVYEGGLKRGPAPDATYYDTVEIAPWLRKGENVIAIAVWHMGKNGFSHLNSGSFGLLFQAEGEGVEILSGNDGQWVCSPLEAYTCADTPAPNMRLSESSIRYDARAYNEKYITEDWYKGGGPEYMGAPSEMAFAPGAGPFGRLVPRPIPLWKDYGVRDYVSVDRHGDTLVCRMPYNLHAGPILKVDAPAGKVINMFTDHYAVGQTRCLSAQYVTRDGVQEYEHLCWLNGETMYYVIPEEVKVLGVRYRETGYGCEMTGKWQCDDPLLNAYWEKAARTLYVCMRDTYYDCPDRERAQWIGDEANELGEAFYLMSPSAAQLAVKGIKEVCAWAKPDGALYGPVPAGNWFRELPMQSLAFVGWYGARRLSFYSGDRSFVKEIYPAIHRYLHETWQLDDKGLPIYRRDGTIWDWPDAGEHQDAEAQLAPWYYLALKAEKEFALELGNDSDAAEDGALMSSLADAYNARYWNGTCYETPGHEGPADDRVQALAVVSGLASADKYPALLTVLSEQHHATTYMHGYVLEALCMMGHPEMAQDLMHYRYPGIMKEECSTLWEHWDHDGSSNHAWSGIGTVTMMEYFAGIQPKDPGFRVFTVKPQMGRLKHIETSFRTGYGTVRLKLDRRGDTISAELDVPEGSAAEVISPSGKVNRVCGGSHRLKL